MSVHGLRGGRVRGVRFSSAAAGAKNVEGTKRRKGFTFFGVDFGFTAMLGP